jgi:hypothetical protein
MSPTPGRSTASRSYPSYEEIQAQIDAARRLQRAERAAGRVAVSARFDSKTQRVIVEMSSGLFFGSPRKLMSELTAATDRQMARVEIDELGSGLIWDELDVQISVIGIILEALGEQVVKAAAGRASGMVVTEAKAAAARRNGAKGGRPRKTGTRSR